MFAGGGDPPDPIFPDDCEPNNSFAAAFNLGTTNTAVRAGLTLHDTPAPGDVDYFKFTAVSTGTVGVEIDFVHLQGNLQLTAYNGAQQQLANSYTSAPGNGREVVSVNVTAGQTYFIKVHGATTATSSPDYSLELRPLSVAFDWTMPKRFGNLFDQWGLPVIPNTRDYARPNPVFIGSVETPQYGVRLDGTGTFLGSSSVTYNWHIVGNGIGRDLVGGPILNTDLPEGTYDVTLTASAGTTTLSTSRQVKVVDHLIVAMGDSYGSGEGNPHQPQQFDFFGFVTSGAKWAQGSNDPATAAHRRAHRSSYAGVVKAAVDLENGDAKSSVTLVFLDHTGATIPAGMLGPQDSGDPGEPGSDIAQVDQMSNLVGNRRIDGLVMSIGGNDAGFVDVVSRLVAADPTHPNYQGILADIWYDAQGYRNALINTFYPQLRDRLAAYDIGQIYLSEYPDPTRDSTGNTAQQILHDIADGLEVDRNELNQVRDRVMLPLAQAMYAFARRSGWAYVNDVASAFATHGYGDWFRTATDSAILQGPVWNRNTISSEEKAATTGTLHPTADGQDVYRARVGAAWNMPNLVTTNFALTPNAFATGAADGYSLTVKNVNLFGSAGASVARLYLSGDPTVTSSDTMVLEVNVPAIGPGQSVTLTGAIPHTTDPYRNPLNVAYVAPILDVNGQVSESNETDNVPVGINDTASLKPERDIRFDGFNWLFSGPSINPSGTYQAGLGTDELIGQYDIDLWAFDVPAGQRYAFDIDALTSTGSLDTHVRLYSMSGDWVNTFTVLGSNDDARAPGEPTANNGESYLTHTFANAGRYCLVVAHSVNANAIPVVIDGRQPGAEGTYSLTINNVPSSPVVVTSSSFAFDDRPQRVKLSFNANVSASLSVSDLQLRNTTTNQMIPADKIALAWDPATNTASFTFPGYTYGALPDGRYRATLPAGSVSDPQGNALAADVVLDFTFINGDANRDGRVNLSDFNVLAANFGQSNRKFSQGDFTYDGQVNLGDFNVLASRFGQAVAPSMGPSGCDLDDRAIFDKTVDLLA